MTDARQWVQPLFMVYDKGTDELVPLTQSRLDELVAVERAYGMVVCDLRKHQEELLARLTALANK